MLGWVGLYRLWVSMLVDRREAGVEEMQMLGEVNWGCELVAGVSGTAGGRAVRRFVVYVAHM